MSLYEKSFKQLNEMIEEVAYRFFIAKKLNAMKQRGEVLAEDNPPYLVYLLRVEKAYRSLDERERNLINNEFFFQNYQPGPFIVDCIRQIWLHRFVQFPRGSGSQHILVAGGQYG